MLLGMLGTMEIIIIVAVILLIFGPSKLPALGSGIGKMLRGFKKEMKGLAQDDKDEKDEKSENAENDEKREEIDVSPAAPISPGKDDSP